MCFSLINMLELNSSLSYSCEINNYLNSYLVASYF